MALPDTNDQRAAVLALEAAPGRLTLPDQLQAVPATSRPPREGLRTRASHVDIAKGISIALVVFYHSDLRKELPEVAAGLALFRMPLFFFLAGLFLSGRTAPMPFVQAKFAALLRPYLFTSAGILLVSLLMGSDDILWKIKGTLYGVGYGLYWPPMWFLPHLFVSLLLAHTLVRFLRLEQWPVWSRLVLLSALVGGGTLILDVFWLRDVELHGRAFMLPGLPASLDIVPITAAFVLAGFFLRQKVLQFDPTLAQAALALAVFLGVVNFTDAAVGLNLRVFSEPVFAVLGAGAGIFLVLFVARHMERIPLLARMVMAMGSASLLILIFHTPLDDLVLHLGERWGFGAPLAALVAAFVLSIAIPIMARRPMMKVRLLRWAYAMRPT